MLNFSATRTKLGELHLYKFGVIFILILIVLFLSFTNWSPKFWIMLYVTFFFSSKPIKLVQYPFCLLLREVAKKKEKEKEKKK